MWTASNFAHINETPIFILGNQKSGTTIVSKLLARLLGLSATHDIIRAINSPIADELSEGRMSFPDYVNHFRLEFSKDIIKEPGLTMYFPQLVSMFPKARYAMIMRDPRSNIRSILTRHKIDGRANSIEPYWNNLGKSWQRIFGGKGSGIPAGSHIENLSNRWNFIAETYLRNCDRFVLLMYEDFVSAKESQIIKLAERLGETPKHEISSHVNVQYQNKSDHSISVHDFFGEKNIKVIEDICCKNMKALGY